MVIDNPLFAALEREYVVFFLQRFPVVATYLGGSEFDSALAGVDGALRNYSPSALADEAEVLRQFRERFTAVDPGSLDARRRIDRIVALAQIEFVLRLHQVRHYERRSLDSYLEEPFCGVEWQIQGMTATGARSRGSSDEWRRLLERVRAIPEYLEVAAGQLQTGVLTHNVPDWRVLRHSGLSGSLANARYFGETLGRIAESHGAGNFGQSLVQEIRSAGSAAAGSFLRFRDFVADTYFEDPTRDDAAASKPPFREDNYALGTTEYDWALRNNLKLDETAEQLFAASWSRIEETRSAMVCLAGEIAAGQGWQVAERGAALVKCVFERLSEDGPELDEQMLESYRQIVKRMVGYSRSTGLFDVPDDYRLDITLTPEPLRSAIESAGYVPAPAFKRAGVGCFYITPTGDNIQLLKRQHNRHATGYLAAHEGFPGHDWHYKVMAQFGASISPLRWLTPGGVNESSSMWQDSMSVEGWGLYAEALLAEPQKGAPAGFYTSEERLYQLRAQLLRDLRVYLDVGLHTKKLGFDAAVTLFSEVVDFLPGSCHDQTPMQDSAKCASCNAARAAVTRYARLPTQAITYRIGKDQILALRARARRELGDGFNERNFHLELMKQGAIPVAYFADDLIERLKGHA